MLIRNVNKGHQWASVEIRIHLCTRTRHWKELEVKPVWHISEGTICTWKICTMAQQNRHQTLHQCFADDNDNRSKEKRSTTPTDPFISVNERPVDDISLNFFYKPHTVTLLAVSIISVMYFAFVRYVLNLYFQNLSISCTKRWIGMLNVIKDFFSHRLANCLPISMLSVFLLQVLFTFRLFIQQSKRSNLGLYNLPRISRRQNWSR